MNNNLNVLSYKKVQETLNTSKSQYEIVKYLMENLLKSMKSLVPNPIDKKINKEEAQIRSNPHLNL